MLTKGAQLLHYYTSALAKITVEIVQKLLVECPNNEDDDDGNGSESSATNPICEEKICYTRTDQPPLIPEFNPLTLNVGIQCCITAKTFVNAET